MNYRISHYCIFICKVMLSHYLSFSLDQQGPKRSGGLQKVRGLSNREMNGRKIPGCHLLSKLFLYHWVVRQLLEDLCKNEFLCESQYDALGNSLILTILTRGLFDYCQFRCIEVLGKGIRKQTISKDNRCLLISFLRYKISPFGQLSHSEMIQEPSLIRASSPCLIHRFSGSCPCCFAFLN